MPEFESDEQARDWADAWVEEHLPAEVVVSTTQAEREHFESFKKDYGRFVAQFEVEYAALVKVIDDINFVERSSWPDHRAVQYVLAAYNVKTFYSAVDRLARGYYEDCITLTRSLYETFARVLYISCHPDNAYSALVFNPPKGVRKFNLTNFLRDELGLDRGSQYAIMSTFAHSNSYLSLVALRRAIERRGDPERFGLRFEYDPELAEAAMPFLGFVLLAHLRFAVERLVGTATPPGLPTAKEAIDLMTYGFVNHPKEYWRTVARDLDLVFEMLDVADRRADWRAFLQERRAEAE